MARRSLKPQLNQIRTWVRQGRTDAWIAHQLEVTVRELRSFKREHELEPTEAENGGSGAAAPGVEEEPDLRAEDDALVAAELEAERAAEQSEADEEEGKPTRRRRRGRRGGRGRRTAGPKTGRPLEGTFDHGDEGYGLWLDPAVQDDPTYAEHWAGHRSVIVALEPDRIVIRRAGEEGEDAEGESGLAGSEAGAAVAEATRDAGLDPNADTPVGPEAESRLDPDEFDA